MSEKILQLTKKLINYNHLFVKYYEEAREKGITHDFHEIIKPFANEVKSVSMEWSALMQNWLVNNPQKHLHLNKSILQQNISNNYPSRHFFRKQAVQDF